MTTTAPSYDALRGLLGELATLGSVSSLVSWDQETKMPHSAGAARAEQLALLAGLVHERATSAELGERLAACEEDAELTADPSITANLRELRRDFDRKTKLPTDLVQELARLQSQSQEVWKGARANNDFSAFRPYLERLLKLKRREAECHGTPASGELYDNLLDEYEAGATAAEIQATFDPLKERLSALIAEVAERGTPPDTSPLSVHVAESGQHAFGLFVLRAVGFDLDAGRLDTTTHPFCSGLASGDTRLTTRYDEDYFPDALYGTMHEGGHGLYEQGLPKAEFHGLPQSEATSLGVHESQSRLWENCVGRSREFWEWALPHAKSHFGGGLDTYGADDLYRAVNTATPSFIRVEADEATYNLHIMLRFDLERALLRGDLEVADLPAAWNTRFKELLGLEVQNDAQGCLQDVHWAFGLFGYFPTYCLGNLYAAQLWEAAQRALPSLATDIASGVFAPLRGWLADNVHVHGRRYRASELCERATGQALSADPLMRQLDAKLRPIYGL